MLAMVELGAFVKAVTGHAARLGVAVVAGLLAVDDLWFGALAVAVAAGVVGMAVDAAKPELLRVIIVVKRDNGEHCVGGGVDIFRERRGSRRGQVLAWLGNGRERG